MHVSISHLLVTSMSRILVTSMSGTSIPHRTHVTCLYMTVSHARHMQDPVELQDAGQVKVESSADPEVEDIEDDMPDSLQGVGEVGGVRAGLQNGPGGLEEGEGKVSASPSSPSAAISVEEAQQYSLDKMAEHLESLMAEEEKVTDTTSELTTCGDMAAWLS